MILCPFTGIIRKPNQKCWQPQKSTHQQQYEQQQHETTHIRLQIDRHENIDGQNNSVMEELKENTHWVPANYNNKIDRVTSTLSWFACNTRMIVNDTAFQCQIAVRKSWNQINK